MAYRHGGNIWRMSKESGRSDILDFSANINPLGPPEWLRPLISSSVSSLVHYPDPDSASLISAIACRYGISTDEIVIGNGSSELINMLPRALSYDKAVIPVPCYSEYITSAEVNGIDIIKIPLREEVGFALELGALSDSLSGEEIVFIGQPNNPTGRTVDPNALRRIALEHTQTIFIVDEAFVDFVDGLDTLIENRPRNVVILRSMTKFYAIPGLRLGFAVGDAEIMQRMKRLLPAWPVNTLSQCVGERAIVDEDYAERTRTTVNRNRERLKQELAAMTGLKVYPGSANYLLIKLERSDMTAEELSHRMLQQNIAIRTCSDYDGLDNSFFRVAVRPEEENLRLCDTIKSVMAAGGKSRPSARRKTPAIMFQGTSSNAGKSVLAAAMCRILLQDGYRVAPFKAQNMSLNSYVTRDGGEMGRAQVVQAQACRIEPDVRMNPVLLKPSSDTGSQVIICGHPVGNMSVHDYIDYKSKAFETARQAYDSLAEEYDVIVLEGAGSPGEVNLKRHDIVNMNMARYAQSPVLLVGDIDRGGVYASFVGTMEVLSEWERNLVLGFIVNRFRGNPDLLQDAHDYVLSHTGTPVLGIVPYLRNLGLPEEDSVSFKEGVFDMNRSADACVDIAVIDLPHISNFTDFDALRIEPDVRLRRVVSSDDLASPDVVIIPGSKNVISDLSYLQQSGLADKISRLASGGKTEIIGICGGFQMLGKNVLDPFGIESSKERMRGLGLMPVSTVLGRDKTLVRVKATHVDSGHTVTGYEIHHGRTDGDALDPAVRRDGGEVIGRRSSDGMIWGTYLHGIFDADAFRRWFVNRSRVRKGLSVKDSICASYDLDKSLDRLAGVVRQGMRMDDIYRLMGLS